MKQSCINLLTLFIYHSFTHSFNIHSLLGSNEFYFTYVYHKTQTLLAARCDLIWQNVEKQSQQRWDPETLHVSEKSLVRLFIKYLFHLNPKKYFTQYGLLAEQMDVISWLALAPDVFEMDFHHHVPKNKALKSNNTEQIIWISQTTFLRVSLSLCFIFCFLFYISLYMLHFLLI